MSKSSRSSQLGKATIPSADSTRRKESGSKPIASSLPWILSGAAVYAAGLGISLYYSGSNPKTSDAGTGDSQIVTEEERRRVYDAGAAKYESEVCSTETWTGIAAVRQQLVGRAAGRVLEVAAGTGINLTRDLYPSTCTVTCVDCRQATALQLIIPTSLYYHDLSIAQ